LTGRKIGGLAFLFEDTLAWQAPIQEVRLREPHHPAELLRGQADDDRGLGDLELAAACRRGDVAAFEGLYHVHGARLKRIAFNLLGNVNDAEDAVQEVFLRVYRGIDSFKGQSAFSTWIYRILLNCCYDVRRRIARRQESSGPEPESEPGTEREAAAPVADHPLRLALESCLARLTSKHREVFVLFEVEGFKHSEIAAMLNISETLSKNRLYEAKRHLRHLLGTRKES